MKKTNIKISLAITIGILILPVISFAQSTFNLGALDLQLSHNQDQLLLVGDGDTTFSESITAVNHSAQTLDLSIYTTDAKLSGKNFLPANENSAPLDLSTWITLPTNHIELKPQESTELPITINFPPNAGVGQHLGAIMFKYENKDEQGNLVNIEKGIRVRANVTGQAINKYELINPQIKTTDRFITYSATIFNSGNTDLKGAINLGNQNSPATDASQKSAIFLVPGEAQPINLAIEKPSFGQNTIFSKVDLANTSKTFVLDDSFYWPDYLMPLAMIIGLVLFGSVYLNIRKKALSPAKSKTLLFLALSLISIFTAANFSSIQNALIHADVFINIPDTGYLTTIKWGDFSKLNKKLITPTFWNGTIKVSSGRMLIVEKLNNEKSDEIFLNAIGNILTFKNNTAPDNDGVIILFKPDSSDTKPSLTYQNSLSGEEFTIPINLTLDRAKYINYKNAQVEIKTVIAGQNVTLKGPNGNTNIDPTEVQTSPSPEVPIIEVQSSGDLGIITDGQASGDNTTVTPTEPAAPNTRQLQEELGILREIIKDLPSSPEVLSQYILNSDFVEQVSSENNSTTVKANSLLIDKFKEAPLTIKEMSASADQNFIFIPNEKVELVPQQFSFDQKRDSSQQLGEIVFVQNKNSAWSTYISVSDFVSVSGKGSIPANNVTITPGLIKLISQSGIPSTLSPGGRHEISGSDDQATLVDVTPLGEGETIFSMRPQISLNIPAGTPPGVYRAQISIKEI